MVAVLIIFSPWYRLFPDPAALQSYFRCTSTADLAARLRRWRAKPSGAAICRLIAKPPYIRKSDNQDYVTQAWLHLMPPRPVLIAGATASGKSALALRLAERDGGCVINADAAQVYACWRVLTARPGPDDLARAPHALYGHVSCATRYSVGAWLRDATAAIDDARARGLRPIVVGGTGLYLGSLTDGLADIPAIPPEVRRRSEAMLRDGELDRLLASPGARRSRDLGADRPQQPDARPARLGSPDRDRPRPRGLAAQRTTPGPRRRAIASAWLSSKI